MSGYGRQSGVQHLQEYLNVKSVWIKTGWSPGRLPAQPHIGAV